LTGTLPANQKFHDGERLIWFETDLFSRVGETHVPLQRKPSVLDQEQLAPCFPVGIERDFERNTSATQNFQGGESLN
jgi:hypothetical protein